MMCNEDERVAVHLADYHVISVAKAG